MTSRWGILSVAAIVAFGTVGLVPAGHPLAAPALPGVPGATAPAPSISAASVSPSGLAIPSDIGSLAAQHALSAARTAGVRSGVVFVPHASASPAQIARTVEGGTVTPLYPNSPAPMGLAYYGLRAGAGNTLSATILNTTSLMANVDANATGVRALDLVQSSPDSYGVQLNGVLTNVVLFGHGGYSFWTQNVVEFYPDAHLMVLVTNIWNFSGFPALVSGNAILYNGIGGNLSDGPNGTNSVGLLGFYYAEKFLPTPISYPFNLSLYLNSSVIDHRDAVSFGIHLTGPGEQFGYSAWDYAIFNSVGLGGNPVSRPANYTANGFAYNAIGLTNDFELDFGGPGGGSQATFFAADAALGLAYFTGTGYAAVPAAFTSGSETGETSTGAHLAWASGPGGPAGLSPYATMTTGPSFLAGLWNATAPQGSYPLHIAANPASAIAVVTPVATGSVFLRVQPTVAPGGFTSTFDLVPGNYSVLVELSGYVAQTFAVDLTGPTTLYANLTASPALGVYTPLWAFSNGEVASLAIAGSGTAADPYRMPTSEPTTIGPTFGLYNDFGFPVYPAVLFYGTSVPVEFLHPPTFATTTNTAQGAGAGLPATNDPPYWFWNVTNVSLVGAANISGWYAENVYFPLGSNTFNVIFYEGGHNLVANNTFDSMAEGLLLYSGGTFFGPASVGGGNTTVWGNTFREVKSPNSSLGLTTYPQGLGLEVAEPNDLVYNNWFGTPTTAWQLPLNLYTGNAETFPVSWNVTPQPASNVRYAAGFPSLPLTGSIVGTPEQGGNFWWDYGNALNPYNGANDAYGALPYAERATTPVLPLFGPTFYSASYLYPGGDYAPLTTTTLYAVTVQPLPLTADVSWGVFVRSTQQRFDNFLTSASHAVVYLPNGTYTYHGLSSPNFAYVGPSSLSLTVAGANLSVTLAFHVPRGYHVLVFPERGLPKGTSWTVTVNGTNASTDAFNATFTTNGSKMSFAVAPGNYTYVVTHLPGYTINLPSGALDAVGSNVHVHLKFTVAKLAVTFAETGLPNGTGWAITIGTKTHGSTHPTVVFDLPNGTYSYAIHPKAGWTTTYTGTFTVNGSSVNLSAVFVRYTYALTFTESGLANGTNWSVTLAGVTLTAAAPNAIVFEKPNGSYSFSVAAITGYAASPSSGTVKVAAGAAHVAVTFAPVVPVPAVPLASLLGSGPLAANRAS